MKKKSILVLASLSLLFFLPQAAQADEMSQKIQEQTQVVKQLEKEVATITDKQTAVKEEIKAFDTRAVTLENELTTLHNEKEAIENEIKLQEIRLVTLEEMASLQTISQVTTVKNNSVENQKERIDALRKEVTEVEAKIAATTKTIAAEETNKEQKVAEQKELEKAAKAVQTKMANEEAAIERLEAEAAAAKKAAAEAEAAKKAAAERLERTGFISPLARSYSISSGFGQRVDPTGYSGTGHDGIDIPGSAGEAILAARYGTVVEAGFHASAGNYAIVKHDNGYYTYYMHMTENFVSVGQTLETSQQIGTMGTTGNSTGVHLHFGIATGVWSGFVNPTNFI